jgi:serine/threonine protein kinase
MISPDGQVRILDFGIGCLLAETEGESLVDTMSTANSVNSGLDCASPESIMDPTNLTPVGDQYSLGCVLYYCLTGQYPFPEGTAVEKMMCHQHKQPTPLKDLNPDIPDELVAVVEKLMQKVPTARYVNCAEVSEALRPLASVDASAPKSRSMPRLKAPRVAGHKASLSAPAAKPDAPRPPAARPANPLPPRSPSAAAANLPRPGNFHKPAAPAPEPAPEEAAAAPEPAHEADRPARKSLAQRIGTVGVVLLAVLAGAVAWLLSSFINFKP